MFIFIVLFISCYYFFKILKIFSCSGMFRDVPECSGMFRHVPECSMFHVPECSTANENARTKQKQQTEIKRFDWFIERIQTRLAFGWLSERSGEKTSCPRTLPLVSPPNETSVEIPY